MRKHRPEFAGVRTFPLHRIRGLLHEIPRY
jgi:hypothetical protein